jgi:putative ABC transport system permease protein
MLLILLAVVAAAAIATTMDASVAIRLPELAALAAIGVRRGVLARLLIFEGVLLASLGTMLGIIFAEAIRHSIGSFDLGGTTIELASKPVVQVAAAALGVVVGTVGTFKPSLVVARLDLRLAMR